MKSCRSRYSKLDVLLLTCNNEHKRVTLMTFALLRLLNGNTMIKYLTEKQGQLLHMNWVIHFMIYT